jgi:hypothetical protein
VAALRQGPPWCLYAASVRLPDAPDEALLTEIDSMMQPFASLFLDYQHRKGYGVSSK